MSQLSQSSNGSESVNGFLNSDYEFLNELRFKLYMFYVNNQITNKQDVSARFGTQRNAVNQFALQHPQLYNSPYFNDTTIPRNVRFRHRVNDYMREMLEGFNTDKCQYYKPTLVASLAARRIREAQHVEIARQAEPNLQLVDSDDDDEHSNNAEDADDEQTEEDEEDAEDNNRNQTIEPAEQTDDNNEDVDDEEDTNEDAAGEPFAPITHTDLQQVEQRIIHCIQTGQYTPEITLSISIHERTTFVNTLYNVFWIILFAIIVFGGWIVIFVE